tara:strand:+ start:219 stop:734 length:516 start_codon:yes stop_codon:yes gene_type:complete
MKRFLLAATLVLALPASATPLNPAKLTPGKLSDSLPVIGTSWESFCGPRKSGKTCKLSLDQEALVIDGNFRIPYASILRSERFNTWSSPGMERGFLVRLIRNDPAYTGYGDFRKGLIGGKITWNTVLIEYVDSSGENSVALFAFAENRESWQSFAHSMRMISFGARPTDTE